tara:strand:+ start:68 stop:274 length:207 start_codon:yes stop_codon:yes gene_type:complete
MFALGYLFCGVGTGCVIFDTCKPHMDEDKTKSEIAKDFYMAASLWPIVMGAAIWEVIKVVFPKKEKGP